MYIELRSFPLKKYELMTPMYGTLQIIRFSVFLNYLLEGINYRVLANSCNFKM